jgi:small subunit ribosomal protein S10
MAKGKGKKNQEEMRIKLKSFDHRSLEVGVQQITRVVRDTGADIVGPIPLPTRIQKFTVLRSPHVDKKSREQFEMRTHKRLVIVRGSNTRTIEAMKRMNLPAGVEAEIKLGAL